MEVEKDNIAQGDGSSGLGMWPLSEVPILLDSFAKLSDPLTKKKHASDIRT